MQWAARNGYLYVIQLLIAHNADPNISDDQGYNTLHLVTHSSSIMALLYVLHQPVNVDSRDSAGHTSLMWAAYQGDALSVDLLLKHGANPNMADDAGLTPLHWAIVRGNRVCIRRLIESGADMNAKDGEGRTARDMAVELKSLGAWKRALEEGGMNEDGIKKLKPLSDVGCMLAVFIYFPLILSPKAKHQNSHISPSNIVLLRHIYDLDVIAMVYRYHPGHGGVLRYAPCE
jgi:palmitoyltransferase ZDHHC13/17